MSRRQQRTRNRRQQDPSAPPLPYAPQWALRQYNDVVGSESTLTISVVDSRTHLPAPFAENGQIGISDGLVITTGGEVVSVVWANAAGNLQLVVNKDGDWLNGDILDVREWIPEIRGKHGQWLAPSSLRVVQIEA